MFKFVITAKMQNGDAWETVRHTKDGMETVSFKTSLKMTLSLVFQLKKFAYNGKRRHSLA
jgi:hypothetical protein